MKVGVIVGHSKVDQGAVAPAPLATSEWAMWDQVADRMLETAPDDLVLKKFHRIYQGPRRYGAEMRELFDRVNQWEPDITIELHFNYFDDPTIDGFEGISSGSKESINLTKAFLSVGRRLSAHHDRGIKIRSASMRGGLSVHLGRAPAVLLEPFPCSHPASVLAASRLGINGFAEAYHEALAIYRGGVVGKPQGGFSVPADQRPTPEPVAVSAKGKDEWITDNFIAISAACAAEGLSPLEGVAVIYAELGLDRRGRVDPNHVHSLGERGPLPLPEFWKPRDNLTPSQNVREFIRYLGWLKKHEKYAPLFEVGINDLERARILAAAVHGWMYKGNFAGYKDVKSPALPLQSIAWAAANSDGDEPDALLTFLEELGYKHDRRIIKGRLSNIDYATDLVNQIAA